MAQYRYFHEGQLKVDPTTGTKCRTGQLNHQFVEQKFVGGTWIGIGDNDGVRYGDVATAGCRFREGARDGDYVVDVELEVAGFLLAEGDGWTNCGSVSGYWYPQKLGTKVLFWGKVSEISGGQMPNKVTGSSDYLTIAGSPVTFQTPNTAPYIAADTDYIWFTTAGVQRTVTTAELIGYDLQRTPVKYLDDAPNTLEEIVILKVGEILTVAERDNLFKYMHLPILWDNSLAAYGHVKNNRITQNLWPGIPIGLTLTLISGGVKLDWTDNSLGTGETEIWGQSDGAAYALLYTIATGIVTKNDLCTPVDLRYYKIRTKEVGLYSEFTSEVSIVMLDVEMINQTTWCAAGGAYWTSGFDANWTGDGLKLISNGSNGSCVRWSFWNIGATYRTIMTTIRTSGTLNNLYDGGVSNGQITSSTTLISYYIPSSVGMYLQSTFYNGQVTSLSVKRVLLP